MEQFPDDIDRELEELLNDHQPEVSEFDSTFIEEDGRNYIQLLKLAAQYNIVLPQAIQYDPNATYTPEAVYNLLMDFSLLGRFDETEYQLFFAFHGFTRARSAAASEGYGSSYATRNRDESVFRYVVLDTVALDDKVKFVKLANDYLYGYMDPLSIRLNGSPVEIQHDLEAFAAKHIAKELTKNRNQTILTFLAQQMEESLRREIGDHDDLPAFCKNICKYAREIARSDGQDLRHLLPIFQSFGLDRAQEKFNLSGPAVADLVDSVLNLMIERGYDPSGDA